MEAPKELGFGASAPDKCWYFTHQLPDYLSDLNAMHEAEKILNTNQAADYCELLRPIICGCWRLVHATAAQRAEAFLKTLGLWEE